MPPFLPLIPILIVGVVVARVVQKARKRDREFIKRVEGEQAQIRG